MSRKYLGRRKDGWMDGWMEVKAGVRIAYSNQKPWTQEGRKEGRIGGWMEVKAGLRIAYSNQKA